MYFTSGTYSVNKTVPDFRLLIFRIAGAKPAPAAFPVMPVGVVKIDLQAEFFGREIAGRRHHLDHRHRMIVFRLKSRDTGIEKLLLRIQPVGAAAVPYPLLLRHALKRR